MNLVTFKLNTKVLAVGLSCTQQNFPARRILSECYLGMWDFTKILPAAKCRSIVAGVLTCGDRTLNRYCKSKASAFITYLPLNNYLSVNEYDMQFNNRSKVCNLHIWKRCRCQLWSMNNHFNFRKCDIWSISIWSKLVNPNGDSTFNNRFSKNAQHGLLLEQREVTWSEHHLEVWYFSLLRYFDEKFLQFVCRQRQCKPANQDYL